jgi:hypothetical protein
MALPNLMGILDPRTPGGWLWNLIHQQEQHVRDFRAHRRMLRLKRKHPITHRFRRDKLVEIPEKWRARVAHPQLGRRRRQRAAEKRGERRAELRREAQWDLEQWKDALDADEA